VIYYILGLESPVRGNLLANSKQYLQDDSVNKYSKLYEINKARRQAMKEKSPPFHEAMRMQKDEVQSPEIFRSPEKVNFSIEKFYIKFFLVRNNDKSNNRKHRQRHLQNDRKC